MMGKGKIAALLMLAGVIDCLVPLLWLSVARGIRLTLMRASIHLPC
jgi:hypothetical protein